MGNPIFFCGSKIRIVTVDYLLFSAGFRYGGEQIYREGSSGKVVQAIFTLLPCPNAVHGSTDDSSCLVLMKRRSMSILSTGGNVYLFVKVKHTSV